MACATAQIPFPYAAVHPYAYNAHPVVYSAPAAVETEVKSVVLEPNAAEKTPAATTLLEEKEITQKVVTPLTYGVAPFATPYAGYPYHYAAPYAAATFGRKKRQVPVVPANQFTADLLWDSVDLNQDGTPDKAVVPSTPLAYSYSPLALPFATRAFHYGAYPYGAYGVLPLAIKSEEKKETESRKKRQIPLTYSVHNPAEFANDYARSSVDLNQDGTPDNQQFYPYAYSYPYYAGYSATPYYG